MESNGDTEIGIIAYKRGIGAFLVDGGITVVPPDPVAPQDDARF